MEFLTAFEIREKYKNDRVVSFAFEKQMRMIEDAAEKGDTMVELIQSVDFFIDEKGATHIGHSEVYKRKTKDVSGIVLAHFLKMGYKKTKIEKCPYLSWAEVIA